ncbi:MAG: MinD/ParA family protein [Minwuia sp.]|uniref:MinD/ParA family protein n=1 Tax=Minwuia sp. TaxID=2493630 RepID=UPI003A84D828
MTTQHPAMSAQRNAATPHPAAALGRNMIAIASGKGGVGKTWFSVTLAHALGRMGRKVLLFDGDLGLANVDIQLGLTASGDLYQALNGTASFNDIVTRHGSTGIDIVTGRSGVARLADADVRNLDILARGLGLIGDMYDDVVLDLGAGVDRSVRTLAGSAGRILVMTNVEPTSITDAYALIKLLHQQGQRTDMRIVVNSAEDRRDGERTYGKLKTACQNFLGFAPELAGIVRQDRYVSDAIRRQTPLLTRHPTSAAGEDVERIAEMLRKTR